MKAISLCSGIGGLDLAFAAAGFDIVAQVEWDAFFCKVLNKWKPVYWPNSEIMQVDLEDVYHEWNIEPGTIDALFGGIPCQPYSHAGKRDGQDDERNLWPATLEIIRQLHPRTIVIENVAGIITLALDDVCDDLEGEGYTAQPFVFPASAVGASHKRDRVFIVAYTDSIRHNQQDTARGQNTSDSKRDNPAHQPDAGRHKFYTTIRGRKNLAYTTGTRLQARQHAGYRPYTAQEGTGLVAKPERCGDVAHTYSGNQQTQCKPGAVEPQQHSDGCTGIGFTRINTGQLVSPTGNDRPGIGRPVDGSVCETVAAQPQLGRAVDGLSEWLDGYTFPSRPGVPQDDWEEPHVRNTREVTDRTHRLKALGNAVVPQQAYPVAKAVMTVLNNK